MSVTYTYYSSRSSVNSDELFSSDQDNLKYQLHESADSCFEVAQNCQPLSQPIVASSSMNRFVDNLNQDIDFEFLPLNVFTGEFEIIYETQIIPKRDHLDSELEEVNEFMQAEQSDEENINGSDTIGKFSSKLAKKGKFELSNGVFALVKGKDGRLGFAVKQSGFAKNLGVMISRVGSKGRGFDFSHMSAGHKFTNTFGVSHRDLGQVAKLITQGKPEEVHDLLKSKYSHLNLDQRTKLIDVVSKGFTSAGKAFAFTSFSASAAMLISIELEEAFTEATGKPFPTELSAYLRYNINTFLMTAILEKKITKLTLLGMVSDSNLFLPDFVVAYVWGLLYDWAVEKLGLENDPIAKLIVQTIGSRVTKLPHLNSFRGGPGNQPPMIPLTKFLQHFTQDLKRVRLNEYFSPSPLTQPLPPRTMLASSAKEVLSVTQMAKSSVDTGVVLVKGAQAYVEVTKGAADTVKAGQLATQMVQVQKGFQAPANTLNLLRSSLTGAEVAIAGGSSTAAASSSGAGVASIGAGGAVLIAGKYAATIGMAISTVDWLWGRAIGDRDKQIADMIMEMIGEDLDSVYARFENGLATFLLGNSLGHGFSKKHKELRKEAIRRIQSHVDHAVEFYQKHLPKMMEGGLPTYAGKVSGVNAYPALMMYLSDEELPELTDQIKLWMNEERKMRFLGYVIIGKYSPEDMNYQDLGFSSKKEMLKFHTDVLRIIFRNHGKWLATENSRENGTPNQKFSKYFSEGGTISYKDKEGFSKFSRSMGLSNRWSQIQYSTYRKELIQRRRERSYQENLEMMELGVMR